MVCTERAYAPGDDEWQSVGSRRRRVGARRGDREQLHVVEREEPAVVRDPVATPERSQHLHGLVGPRPALGDRYADGIELLGELAADTDADRHPASRPRVEVGDLL